MCRSIMIKGVEALAVECFLTARRYGVEDRIVASLNQTFPLDWEKLAGYLIGRTVQHGRRRAAEMREAAETVAAAGLEPLMTAATAQRQDWVADQADAVPALKAIPEAEWRATIDRLLERLGGRANAAD
jgi:3-hydroxyisobutyrate dehydrogenase-like beta-hydroxyacid dehydrogenase